MRNRRRKPISEKVGSETYEYFPIGKYIVSAAGICDGDPTFKYTRIGVQNAMELLSGGWTIEQVAKSYNLPVEAVREAIDLSYRALQKQAI